MKGKGRVHLRNALEFVVPLSYSTLISVNSLPYQIYYLKSLFFLSFALIEGKWGHQ